MSIRAPHTPGGSLWRTKPEIKSPAYIRKDAIRCKTKQIGIKRDDAPRLPHLRSARWGWRWCSTGRVWRAWWWRPSYSAELQKNGAPLIKPLPSLSRPDTHITQTQRLHRHTYKETDIFHVVLWCCYLTAFGFLSWTLIQLNIIQDHPQHIHMIGQHLANKVQLKLNSNLKQAHDH